MSHRGEILFILVLASSRVKMRGIIIAQRRNDAEVGSLRLRRSSEAGASFRIWPAPTFAFSFVFKGGQVDSRDHASQVCACCVSPAA